MLRNVKNGSDTCKLDASCIECGWPIVQCCVNWGPKVRADTDHLFISDYYYYCSNKACIKHYGEPVDQGDPDWVLRE